jgi:hypothetical protein
MTYPVEMDAAGMICIPNFIKTGSGIQKLMRRGYTQTEWRSHKPTLGK